MSGIIVRRSNELIDPQANMLVEFLRDMGLPSENIIADLSERNIVGDNLQALVLLVPQAVRKDARYLSKFIIGAGIGLFDYSLNAVWNEVVVNLRKKAMMYGLDIFYDTAVGGSKARDYYTSEDELPALKDSVLLDTCRTLELISDTTYKKLKHILEMRNDVGISHPNNYNINAFELLAYLQNCIENVLTDNPTEAALHVQAFIRNLKTRTEPLDPATSLHFDSRIRELPTHLCGSMMRTIFGIYVALDTNLAVRKNISLIAPSLWASCGDDARYKLGIVLEGYNVNLHKDKHTLGQQFFDTVGGNSFRSPSERVIMIDELITELTDKHNGWDNFHHEAPVAATLYSYMPDQASIFDNLAARLFKAVMICRIGRGVPYCEGVSPNGKKYYEAILALASDKFCSHVMVSLTHFEIKQQLTNDLCRRHCKAALTIVQGSVINGRLQECLTYLIDNVETKPNCVETAEFKRLSASYIAWGK